VVYVAVAMLVHVVTGVVVVVSTHFPATTLLRLGIDSAWTAHWGLALRRFVSPSATRTLHFHSSLSSPRTSHSSTPLHPLPHSSSTAATVASDCASTGKHVGLARQSVEQDSARLITSFCLLHCIALLQLSRQSRPPTSRFSPATTGSPYCVLQTWQEVIAGL
jgi:hypothetical protein